MPPLRHSTRRASARRSRGGFSLTDLVVAMVLIAVIATLAVPAFFNRSEVTLENAAVLFARDLRAAQNRAAYLARDVRVGFLENGDGYWIDDTKRDDGAVPVPYLTRSYSENAVFEGVTITDVALGDGADLVYTERGIARTGARITLSYDGDLRIVIVDAETGSLSILGTTSGYLDNGY